MKEDELMQKAIYVLIASTLLGSCVSRTTNNNNTTTVHDTTVVVHDTVPAKTDTAHVTEVASAQNIKYTLVTGRSKVRAFLKNYSSIPVLLAANRVDSANIGKLDTLLVPGDSTTTVSVEQVSPFPADVPFLRSVRKIVYFSYPAQYFAAYEGGRLVHTGPTNMGRRKDPTPTGVYFTNWKAEKTKSTFNDEWELKWNFNIDNKEGIGWHQYAMPGYPASHSCLRLMETDAKWLYDWADQWVMKGGNVTAQGTPVIIFGSYPFGGPKPWLQLVNDPNALNITVQQLQTESAQYMDKAMAEQGKRK